MDRDNFLPDILIYDPEVKSFIIHIEFNPQQKIVQAYLIRKENT